MRHRTLARLALLPVLLLTLTACLEHFEALRTTVAYDPFRQSFTVERVFVGVDSVFLGCADVDDCVEAIGRTLTLSPDLNQTLALSDRLMQRLLESGAEDVQVVLHREDDRLDVVVTYTAAVGSAAADDTLVRAEWTGRGAGRYYLVVDAQDAVTPPKRHRSRKVARTSGGALSWVESWVLPRGQRQVEVVLPVAETDPLFARFPELAPALEARGWLDRPAEIEAPPAVAAADPEPAAPLRDTGAEPAEPAPPRAAEVRPARAKEEAPAAPFAKAWFYDARISGGVTAATAAVAVEPLVPAVTRCYADRQRAVPDLGGTLFLSSLVKGDGQVLGTSVSGSVSDPELLACAEEALRGIRFAVWGDAEQVSDVVVPVVLRVETPPTSRRR